jgi:hypothetical protein
VFSRRFGLSTLIPAEAIRLKATVLDRALGKRTKPSPRAENGCIAEKEAGKRGSGVREIG